MQWPNRYQPSSCFLLSDTLTRKPCTGVLIWLINAAPRPLTPSRSCTMSERHGNLLTLHVNKAVNPTDATRPSIIFQLESGSHASPEWSIFYRGVSRSVCRGGRVNDRENASRTREEETERGREGESGPAVTDHPDWFRAHSQPGFGGNIRHW